MKCRASSYDQFYVPELLAWVDPLPQRYQWDDVDLEILLRRFAFLMRVSPSFGLGIFIPNIEEAKDVVKFLEEKLSSGNYETVMACSIPGWLLFCRMGLGFWVFRGNVDLAIEFLHDTGFSADVPDEGYALLVALRKGQTVKATGGRIHTLCA